VNTLAHPIPTFAVGGDELRDLVNEAIVDGAACPTDEWLDQRRLHATDYLIVPSMQTTPEWILTLTIPRDRDGLWLADPVVVPEQLPTLPDALTVDQFLTVTDGEARFNAVKPKVTPVYLEVRLARLPDLAQRDYASEPLATYARREGLLYLARELDDADEPEAAERCRKEAAK